MTLTSTTLNEKSAASLPRVLQNKDLWLSMLVSALLLLPALAWVLVDQSAIRDDASQYAKISMDLYHALKVSPGAWWQAMMASGPYKAQGTAWIGQFFVPLGDRLGSIDNGLLFSIILTNWISLALMYRLIRKMGGDRLLAALGCIALASGPVFFFANQRFMTEPLQLLAVMWFLWIMVMSPRWPRALTLSQMLGAGIMAMLAKATSASFSIFPALAVLYFTLRPDASRRPWGWTDHRTLLTLLGVLPVGLTALFWYSRNIRYILMHIEFASNGSGAYHWLWGWKDSYINTLLYWVGGLGRSLFISPGFLIIVLLLLATVLYLLWKQRNPFSFKRPIPDEFIFSAAVALQAITVLLLFANVYNRQLRFLVPALPFSILLICQPLARLRRPLLTVLLIGVFAIQFGLVQAQAWGWVPRPEKPIVWAVDRTGEGRSTLDWLVARTCSGSKNPVTNILGAENTPNGMTWLAAEPANYAVAKSLSTGVGPAPCFFTYFAGSYFGGSAEQAWGHILHENVKFVVIADPKVYPPTEGTNDETLFPENMPVIVDLLENSGYYKKADTMPGDPGIVIYERVRK